MREASCARDKQGPCNSAQLSKGCLRWMSAGPGVRARSTLGEKRARAEGDAAVGGRTVVLQRSRALAWCLCSLLGLPAAGLSEGPRWVEKNLENIPLGTR